MTLWPFLSLTLILAAAAVLVYVLLPWPMAFKLLRPPRMTDGKAVYLLKRLSPADLGIDYHDVTFDVLDQQQQQGGRKLTLTAWWMPHPRRGHRTAVLVHGYADAKVGAIAWAPLFQSLGYHLLAIDLRAHGSSGGVDVTAGYYERHDLSQVLDQLRARHPHETRDLVLFGVSLGAAVVAATAAMRDDLTAAILESPYADYPTAVTSHADLMGMPGPSFVRRALRHAQQLTGANFAEVAPTNTIPLAKCPVLVISAGNDPLVGPSLPLLKNAVAQRTDHSAFWEVADAYHVECLLANGADYRQRIADFLSAARGTSPDTMDAVAVETRINADHG